MKKKLMIIICAVIVAAATTGIILGITLNKKDDLPPEPPVIDTSKGELSVPRGLTLNNTILSWDNVQNATEYTVCVNDVEYSTNECSIDLNGKATERAKLSVFAKANGYANSKKSIEKLYITVIDEIEIASMNDEVTNLLAPLVNGDSNKAKEMFGENINNVAVALYKEGLVTKDVEKIVTTMDDISSSVSNFVPNENTNASEYVELMTNQISKIIDLEINSYATAVAIKELSLLVVNTINSNDVQNKKLLYKPTLKVEFNKYDVMTIVGEYLENMPNRDLEKIAYVLDSLKSMYEALEVRLPEIFKEIDLLAEKFNKEELIYEEYISLINSLIIIKDDIVNSVLVGLPSMEDFTEVITIFNSIFEICTPDYVEENIFDLTISEFQKLYSGIHKTLSLLSEMNAELFAKITPYINDIKIIVNEEIISEIQNINNPIDYVYAVLEEAGLSEEEADDLIFGVLMLVEDITETPEELVNNISSILNETLTPKFEEADYSVLTKDPVIGRLIEIASSEDPNNEFKEFLINDININKFITFKENKTMEDFLEVLSNVSIEELITYFTTNEKYNINDLVKLLEIEEVIVIDVEGFVKHLSSLVDMETIALFNDIIKIDEISDIEKILKDYFKINIDFEETFKMIITRFLEEYKLNINYVELFNGICKVYGIDRIYENIKQIHEMIAFEINDFEKNYTPLDPSFETPELETILKYGKKYLSYIIFEENSSEAVVDLQNIYNKILELKMNDDILNIFNNVIDLFKNFDYSLDLNEYINNQEYQKKYNETIKILILSLIDEIDNTQEWFVNLQPNIVEISNLIDQMTIKYFELNFNLSNETVNFFQFIKKYELTDKQKEDIEKWLNEHFDQFINLVIDCSDDLNNLILEINQNYENYYEELDMALNYLQDSLYNTVIEGEFELSMIYEYINNPEFMNTLFIENLDEIKEVVKVVKKIYTIDDTNVIRNIDDKIEKCFNNANLEYDYSLYDLYCDIHVLMELILNYEENPFDFDGFDSLIKDFPSIEDVILGN